jgi:predicted metal-dependent hydrolase
MKEAYGTSALPGPCQEPPSPTLLVGVEEFNRGEFFECHETLEALWMAEQRPVRRLYQGILQIGVAFHHLRAGRNRAAVFLLRRGSNYLQPFAPICMNVDVAQLLSAAGHCLAEIERLGPEGVGEFDWSLAPQIRMKD